MGGHVLGALAAGPRSFRDGTHVDGVGVDADSSKLGGAVVGDLILLYGWAAFSAAFVALEKKLVGK